MKEKDFKSLVIEKAKEIFTVYGYKKTNMEDIAKACHKSKALIYHHYKSKEEIFRICVNNEIDKLLFKLKKLINDNIPIRDKFNSFFKITNTWFNDKTNMYQKIISEVFDYIDVIRDIIENLHFEIMEIIKSILNEGMKKNIFKLDNIELTTKSILQMIMGFMYSPLRQILNLNINVATDINKFIDIIYYGLEKR